VPLRRRQRRGRRRHLRWRGDSWLLDDLVCGNVDACPYDADDDADGDGV
jgi:hypothetical protein